MKLVVSVALAQMATSEKHVGMWNHVFGTALKLACQVWLLAGTYTDGLIVAQNIDVFLLHTLAQWQRDLCIFYNELREWRSTAIQCGLQVPVVEPSGQGTAEQQWSEARDYWNVLRDLWTVQAQSREITNLPPSQPAGEGMFS